MDANEFIEKYRDRAVCLVKMCPNECRTCQEWIGKKCYVVEEGYTSKHVRVRCDDYFGTKSFNAEQLALYKDEPLPLPG